MAYGDNQSESSSTDTESKWANINFKNVRHPVHDSGSAAMQRYFDDAEYVKELFPSRTTAIGEVISGIAQARRIMNGSGKDRDEADDLLKTLAYLLFGSQDRERLIEYIEENWEPEEDAADAEATTDEAPADD
jgi:hypothetical protein